MTARAILQFPAPQGRMEWTRESNDGFDNVKWFLRVVEGHPEAYWAVLLIGKRARMWLAHSYHRENDIAAHAAWVKSLEEYKAIVCAGIGPAGASQRAQTGAA